MRLQIRVQRRVRRFLIRWITRSIAGIAALLAAYVVAAALGGLIPDKTGRLPVSDDITEIVLINGPIHYDILVPIDMARQDFAWLSAHGIALDHPQVQWLVLGWGAQEFYTSTGTYTDVSARAIWRGVTGDSAVIRVSVAGAVARHWPRIALDPDQRNRLTRAVTDSFANGAETQPTQHPGFSEFDRFFPAVGRFHLFRTCNVWIGQMLQAAHVRFGAWTPTPYAITLSHWRFHRP